MVGISRSIFVAMTMAVALFASTPDSLYAQSAQVATRTVSGRTGDVYLLRGLMNVFSQGMDTLGAKLRDKGFNVQVLNHASWSMVAQKIAERYKSTRSPEPVFLIGHSLGADAVILISERLQTLDVPVALAVTFDPVNPRPVPTNVKKFINFYQSNNGWGAAVKPGTGFKATLVNTDLKDHGEIGHTSIDKADFLHAEVVDELTRLSKPIKRQIASTTASASSGSTSGVAITTAPILVSGRLH
jgi:hypothetical protein